MHLIERKVVKAENQHLNFITRCKQKHKQDDMNSCKKRTLGKLYSEKADTEFVHQRKQTVR